MLNFQTFKSIAIAIVNRAHCLYPIKVKLHSQNPFSSAYLCRFLLSGKMLSHSKWMLCNSLRNYQIVRYIYKCHWMWISFSFLTIVDKTPTITHVWRPRANTLITVKNELQNTFTRNGNLSSNSFFFCSYWNSSYLHYSYCIITLDIFLIISIYNCFSSSHTFLIPAASEQSVDKYFNDYRNYFTRFHSVC